MYILVKTFLGNYLFKKDKNNIIINNRKHLLNINNLGDEDEYIKNEIEKYYNDLKKKGFSIKYSMIKSCLFSADYIEIGLPIIIEFFDLIILFIMDCFEDLPASIIDNKPKIIIIEETGRIYIDNDNNKENIKEFYINIGNSACCPGLNLNLLLKKLIIND